MKTSVLISAIVLVLTSSFSALAEVTPSKKHIPTEPKQKRTELVKYSAEAQSFLADIETYYHETFDSAAAHVGDSDAVSKIVVTNAQGEVVAQGNAKDVVVPNNAKLLMTLDHTEYYITK